MEKQSLFLESAIAIAFITAFLYCANAAYYGGYFNSFHLDPDLLEQNFHLALYSGFLKLLTLLSQMRNFLIIFFVLILNYFYLVLPVFSKRWNCKRFLIKTKWEFIGKKTDKKITQDEKKKYLSSFLISNWCALLFLFLRWHVLKKMGMMPQI